MVKSAVSHCLPVGIHGKHHIHTHGFGSGIIPGGCFSHQLIVVVKEADVSFIAFRGFIHRDAYLHNGYGARGNGRNHACACFQTTGRRGENLYRLPHEAFPFAADILLQAGVCVHEIVHGGGGFCVVGIAGGQQVFQVALPRRSLLIQSRKAAEDTLLFAHTRAEHKANQHQIIINPFHGLMFHKTIADAPACRQPVNTQLVNGNIRNNSCLTKSIIFSGRKITYFFLITHQCLLINNRKTKISLSIVIFSPLNFLHFPDNLLNLQPEQVI